MLLDIALSIFTVTSVEEHIEYLNFRSKIHLDHPVQQQVKDFMSGTGFFEQPDMGR